MDEQVGEMSEEELQKIDRLCDRHVIGYTMLRALVNEVRRLRQKITELQEKIDGTDWRRDVD